MGATITDAILQAGLNYKNVVYPRIKKILNSYANYKTTCDFIILFKTIPLNQVINFNNNQKLNRIKDLSWFLFKNEIENEIQLSKFLQKKENIDNLISIKGIGPKTVDYLKKLVGLQAIPIDRHLFKFLELAGVPVKNYNEAHTIFKSVAKQLEIQESILDNTIWTYMSSLKQNA